MNFAVVMELAVLIAYVTILVGGRASREAGWKVLAGLLGLVAVGELLAMALVVCPNSTGAIRITEKMLT